MSNDNEWAVWLDEGMPSWMTETDEEDRRTANMPYQKVYYTTCPAGHTYPEHVAMSGMCDECEVEMAREAYEEEPMGDDAHLEAAYEERYDDCPF